MHHAVSATASVGVIASLPSNIIATHNSRIALIQIAIEIIEKNARHTDHSFKKEYYIIKTITSQSKQIKEAQAEK